MTSHYIGAFTQRRGHGKHAEEIAICGRWTPIHDHSVEPTCKECEAWLEQDAVDTEALVKQWAAEDPRRGARP